MFNIEDGVKVSPSTRISWPFKDMKAGQSVLITDPMLENKARIAAMAVGRQRGWKFTARKGNDGLRVHRIE